MEWVECEPAPVDLRKAVAAVFVFAGRSVGHLAGKGKDDLHLTRCGLWYGTRYFVNNGSHYGWDYDQADGEWEIIYSPPHAWEPTICKRCVGARTDTGDTKGSWHDA